MATLDYSGFPHIFADILAYCDDLTQNKLRMLSSAARLDVDRLQCRYLLLTPRGGALGSREKPEVRVLHRSCETINEIIPRIRSTPLFPYHQECGGQRFCSKARSAIEKDILFALSNAQRIHIDHEGAYEGHAQYLRQFKGSEIRLRHNCFARHKTRIHLPPVEQLSVRLTGASESCGLRIEHYSPRLRIISGRRPGLNPVASTLLNAAVVNLVIFVLDPRSALPFFKATEPNSRNPKLHILVVYADPAPCLSDAPRFPKELAQQVDVRYESKRANLYSAGPEFFKEISDAACFEGRGW